MVFDPTTIDGVLGNEYRADALGMQWRTNGRPYEILDDGANIDRGGFFIPDKNWKTLRPDWIEQSDADLDLGNPPVPFRRVAVEFRSGNVETGWWADALTWVLLDPQKLYRRRWFKQMQGGRRIYFSADDYRDGTRGHVQLGVAILELLHAGLYVPVKVTLTGHASINVYAQPAHHGKHGYFHVAYGMARAWQNHFGQTRHVSMFPFRVVRGSREKVGAGQQSAFVHLPYPDFDALPDYNDADALKSYVGKMWRDEALFFKALNAERGLFVRWREELADSFASGDDDGEEPDSEAGLPEEHTGAPAPNSVAPAPWQ